MSQSPLPRTLTSSNPFSASVVNMEDAAIAPQDGQATDGLTAYQTAKINLRKKVAYASVFGVVAVAGIVGASVVVASSQSGPPSTDVSVGQTLSSVRQNAEPYESTGDYAPIYTIPQYASEQERASRADEVAAVQSFLFNTERKMNSNTPDNIADFKGRNYTFMPGPVFAANPQTQLFMAPEIGYLQAKFAADKVEFPIPDLVGLPLNSLDDIKNFYRVAADNTRMPLPLQIQEADQGVSAEAAFMHNVINLAGHNMQQIKYKLPFKLSDAGLDDATLADLLGYTGDASNINIDDYVSTLIATGDLYELDFSFANFEDPTSTGKYTPATQAIFVLHKKRLQPVAIRIVETGVVYTPKDAETNEWELAQLALGATIAIDVPWAHFLQTHLLIEPINVELNRHLPKSHPLFPLLSHHMTNVHGLTVIGSGILLKRGVPLDDAFGCGVEGSLAYMESVIEKKGLEFKRLEDELSDTGMWGIRGYYMAKDSIRTKRAIRGFVRAYLKAYYPKRSRDVRSDYELQAWAKGSCEWVKGFPCSFDNFKDVLEAVTEIIYRVAVKHHALNTYNYYNMMPANIHPPAFHKPMPTTKGETVNPVEFIVNDSISLIKFMAASSAYSSVQLTDDITLGRSYGSSALDMADPRIEALVEINKDAMELLNSAVEIRTDFQQQYSRPTYPFLKPSLLPFNVLV